MAEAEAEDLEEDMAENKAEEPQDQEDPLGGAEVPLKTLHPTVQDLLTLIAPPTKHRTS